MITSPTTARRLLIPRWRTFETTISAGELSSEKQVRALSVSSPSLRELQNRQKYWCTAPSEVTAAELVESAIVHGCEEIATGAAQFLTSVQADVTPLVRRQSQQLLERTSNASTQTRKPIAALREQLRDWPENPILWVELALRQIISGARESAVRSMRIALQLAPDNRHVLRSAARLFSHVHEPDVGYYFLKKSPATENDPWLISAEIAMASRIDRRATFLRKGLSLLESSEGQSALEFSELAGAAATTFLDGGVKRARRLFMQSLSNPTDSAVAQAEWASQASGEKFFDADSLASFTHAKEAQALRAFSVGDYRTSLRAAIEWIEEEPFSGRAHATAASAANTMDDYARAIDICTQGIRQDPKSPHLRNSLIFALGASGNLQAAEAAIAEMKSVDLDRVNELILSANRGLVAFRRGRLGSGEAFYKAAIAGFKRQGHDHLSVSALAYFAREATRAAHPNAPAFVKELGAAAAVKKHKVAERILGELAPRESPKS